MPFRPHSRCGSPFTTPSTSTTPTTTFLSVFGQRWRRDAEQAWQDVDVRGRVERGAYATAREDRAATSSITTGPGEVMSPARADSGSATTRNHYTLPVYRSSRATA
jgi:hypothetical protein